MLNKKARDWHGLFTKHTGFSNSTLDITDFEDSRWTYVNISVALFLIHEVLKEPPCMQDICNCT